MNGNVMADTVTKKRRSEIMASIGQKDTMPELRVRSFLHRKGLRYVITHPLVKSEFF
ncbi:MAG: hypothetical protein GY748_18170 [Planctomycetaceae bacterium]|nr:hypothetical protein [Planctomycetaceae bacterium]